MKGLRYIPRLRPVVVAQYGGRERSRLTRSFETPPRSTHPPTAPQDEREGGEVYVGPDASTGSAGTRGGAARTRGGLKRSATKRGHSRVGRGTPRLQEPDWERITVDCGARTR